LCRYYHIQTEKEKAEEQVARARARRAASFVKRPIRHPYFKNVSPLQATELLRDAELGEYLLRPSIKFGTNAIAITIKVSLARSRATTHRSSALECTLVSTAVIHRTVS
jgi:transcription elongation factor SPT6